MRPVALLPAVHFFVCANRRAETDPLGPGCGDAGRAVFDAMKACVAARGEHRRVWITETRCLGICPRSGATVAVYPRARLVTEVLAGEADALYRAEAAS